MTLASLPDACEVFIDANILVYNETADAVFGHACKHFIERIARQEIKASTSSSVLGEFAHRIMTLEAMAQFDWPFKGIAQRLRQHPAELQKLTQFRQAVEEIPQIGIQVLPVDFDLIAAATAVSLQSGLLTGNALVVAVMEANGLTHLASNDADFDRVPGLTRYAPV